MEIKKITGDNFQTEVTGAGQPVLLEFYADGCSPCSAQLPVLEEAAEEACDVKFCRIQVDEEPKIADRFGVTAVPTMLILNGNKVFRTIQGFHSLEEILAYLEM
jgi:thioredoxin 1